MNRIKKVIFLTFAYITVSACSLKEDIPVELTNNTLSSEMDIAVDEIYITHKDNLNTVGISIGMLKNGETHFYGYGETKKGSGLTPTKDTFFEIGSITKTFTSILATNMLLEQGLDIEQTIKPYLPNNLPKLNRNGIELNFKHLLTHTSGLSRMPNNFNLSRDAGKEFADYDERHLYAFLENARIHADPFTQYAYSNLGMGLVGTILKRNYDIGYSKVLQQKLTNPLGLNNTTANFAETAIENWAMGYNLKGKESDYWKTLNALDGAGVIKSTAGDLIKYAEANINPPETMLGEAIRLTHKVYFKEYETNDHTKTRNCLGWFEYINDNVPNETFRHHNGATGGFNSDFFINLENQTALILLFNKNVAGVDGRQALITELLHLLSE
ncbi:beta-lactamase family protein [Aurantibacter crassamenti]|uniref:serine hydrolase domain-containing protein n=1 Tax=Aurantibacter crassamenti TaxID=1837375 RepID=UPI0019398F77|nr:serine hydrolase domain-containing protein [Aurantibacter crassamenti]MBM1108155.1 beta-lactamase family protein [Aurantibacter crassamenti]